MAWHVFDYYDLRDRNVFDDWLASLDARHRARIMSKLRDIHSYGGSGLPNMITDTTEPHIKELVLNTKQMALRVFLCRGPVEFRTQITLLGGGREKDVKYVTTNPHITPTTAEAYRQELFLNPSLRRKPHDFPEDNLG
jgi:hypothetical protein